MQQPFAAEKATSALLFMGKRLPLFGHTFLIVVPIIAFFRRLHFGIVVAGTVIEGFSDCFITPRQETLLVINHFLNVLGSLGHVNGKAFSLHVFKCLQNFTKTIT